MLHKPSNAELLNFGFNSIAMKTLEGSYTGQEKLEYIHVGFSLFLILFETWCCQIS